ncbi:cytochrome b5 domain-containing protein [Fusibacter bizertensis]
MKKTWMAIFLTGLTAIIVGCGSNNSGQVTSETSSEKTEATTVTQTVNDETTIETTGVDTTSGEEIMETTVDASGNVLNVYTAETLAKYNGKDGQPAYVAYEGKVYDVSNVKEWKTGTHQGKYEAGKDYTEVLNNVAPHPASFLLENGVLVGILK